MRLLLAFLARRVTSGGGANTTKSGFHAEPVASGKTSLLKCQELSPNTPKVQVPTSVELRPWGRDPVLRNMCPPQVAAAPWGRDRGNSSL